MATLLTVGLVALGLGGCKKSVTLEEKALSNHDRKMQAVTNEVAAKKKSNKALLLVAFGSTWEAPQRTFDGLKKAFGEKFSDRDVYFSFTSEICMTRCKQKPEINKEYYAPAFYMEALGLAGYTDIAVQSLHVVPGEEFLRVSSTIKDFHNNGDHPEFEEVTVYLGGPLLAEKEDCENVAKLLHEIYKDRVGSSIVCFMGHGNPETYNYGNGNMRYTEIEEALQSLNKNYFVGTVDMEENLIEHVVARMKEAQKLSGTVLLHPLMSVAGDHANNDMKGGVNPDEPEKDSWRYVMKNEGYDCTLENCTLKGLADYPAIVDVWIEHMNKALADKPMYPSEE